MCLLNPKNDPHTEDVSNRSRPPSSLNRPYLLLKNFFISLLFPISDPVEPTIPVPSENQAKQPCTILATDLGWVIKITKFSILKKNFPPFDQTPHGKISHPDSFLANFVMRHLC